jgi:hypothetical protein
MELLDSGEELDCSIDELDCFIDELDGTFSELDETAPPSFRDELEDDRTTLLLESVSSPLDDSTKESSFGSSAVPATSNESEQPAHRHTVMKAANTGSIYKLSFFIIALLFHIRTRGNFLRQRE